MCAHLGDRELHCEHAPPLNKWLHRAFVACSSQCTCKLFEGALCICDHIVWLWTLAASSLWCLSEPAEQMSCRLRRTCGFVVPPVVGPPLYRMRRCPRCVHAQASESQRLTRQCQLRVLACEMRRSGGDWQSFCVLLPVHSALHLHAYRGCLRASFDTSAAQMGSPPSLANLIFPALWAQCAPDEVSAVAVAAAPTRLPPFSSPPSPLFPPLPFVPSLPPTMGVLRTARFFHTLVVRLPAYRTRTPPELRDPCERK